MTKLVQAEELTDRELSVALVFLAFAGMETTRNQLGLALQTLLQHPDQWALLAERPELGANAVEEVMRVNPTVTWVTREALEDVEFQGLHIPKGGIVQMLSHAAGTDPRAVPDPSFDITRAAAAAPRLRRRDPPLPRALRGPHRHGGGAAAARAADAGRGMRRARSVVAGVGEHRCGVLPDPLHPDPLAHELGETFARHHRCDRSRRGAGRPRPGRRLAQRPAPGGPRPVACCRLRHRRAGVRVRRPSRPRSRR